MANDHIFFYPAGIVITLDYWIGFIITRHGILRREQTVTIHLIWILLSEMGFLSTFQTSFRGGEFVLAVGTINNRFVTGLRDPGICVWAN